MKTLCDRALLIDQGLLIRDDTPDAVLDYYNAMIAAQRADYEMRQSEAAGGGRVTRSGTAEVTVERVDLLVGGEPVRAVRSGDAAVLRIVAYARSAVSELTAGILIRDRLGNDVFGTNTFHLGNSRRDVAAGEHLTVEFAFPSLSLGVGSYSITVALHAADRHVAGSFDWWDRALVVQVVPGSGPAGVGVCVLPVSATWRAPSTVAAAAEPRMPQH